MKRATNSPLMKLNNRRLVLDLIRRGPVSRAEIASLTSLTRASVTMIADELIEQGLIRESHAVASGVGRRPVLMEIVPDARCIAGVNIKRGEVDVGLVELGGGMISGEVLSYDGADAEEMIGRIARSMERQVSQSDGLREKLLGVGLCAPGPLDAEQGLILTPPNCGRWHNVPAARLLEEACGYPVSMENVSNALALEEQYFGQGRGCGSFMAVQINEGIGAGVMIRDRLYRGAQGLGSELGHISIELDGRMCDCGNRGCLERYASVPAILEGSPYKSWQELVDRLGTDAEANRLLDLEAKYLAHALVSAINLYDVERVVLLGDVAYRPEALLEKLNALVGPRVIMRSAGARKIVSSETESFVRTGAIVCLHGFYQG